MLFLVFSDIEKYAPGFTNSIIGWDMLTPPDIEDIFGLTGGVCIYFHHQKLVSE